MKPEVKKESEYKPMSVKSSDSIVWDILSDPYILKNGVTIKLFSDVDVRVGYGQTFFVNMLIGGRYNIPPKELIPKELQNWYYTIENGIEVPNAKNLEGFSVRIDGLQQHYTLTNPEDFRKFVTLLGWSSKVATTQKRTNPKQCYYIYHEERAAVTAITNEFDRAEIISEIKDLSAEETLIIASYLGERVRNLSTDVLKKRLLDHLISAYSLEQDKNKVVYALRHKNEARTLSLIHRALEYGILTQDYTNNTLVFDGTTLMSKDPEAYIRWSKNPANAAVIESIKSKLEARLSV